MTSGAIAAVAILAFVTVQRLAELVIARRNTRLLLSRGAYEVGAGHYPLIVAVHASWLATLWLLAPGQPISGLMLGLYGVLQLGRLWVLAAMGERWTTRIIILPNAPLVRGGPFRFLRHPNYTVVVAEIAVLPLVFGLTGIAILFSLLNAAVLMVRLRAEEKALAPLRAA
jgi:methyltransferase